MSEWLTAGFAVAIGFAAGWTARHFLVQRRTRRIAAEPPPSASEVRSTLGPSETPSPGAPEGPAPARPPSRRPESLGASTAGRIVLHLAGLGRLGDDDVARRGHTQAGMADAVGMGQGGVAKVLARLEAAGVVRHDRRHVSGSPSRLKVYRLTAQGEALARDLRSRGRVP